MAIDGTRLFGCIMIVRTASRAIWRREFSRVGCGEWLRPIWNRASAVLISITPQPALRASRDFFSSFNVRHSVFDIRYSGAISTPSNSPLKKGENWIPF